MTYSGPRRLDPPDIWPDLNKALALTLRSVRGTGRSRRLLLKFKSRPDFLPFG